MFTTFTSDRFLTTLTNGRNRQSLASIVGGFEREGLPLRRIHQHDDRVFEPSIGRDRKLLKNAPAGSGGNPTAIDRIGKRDQVKPLGIGFPSVIVTLPAIVPPSVT